MTEPQVLIADDNPAFRGVVALVLREHGIGATFAGDGEAALALARDTHPDLVILDLSMPALDGHGVIEALRRERSGADAPLILVVTASDDPAERSRVIEAGADGFLSKPIDWDRFSDEIAERLGKPRQDGELQPA